MSKIEDIILDNDQRGISKLRGHLPENFCEDAARLILDNPGHALVISGFFILGAMASETDGPPGAYFIGKALEKVNNFDLDIRIVSYYEPSERLINFINNERSGGI